MCPFRRYATVNTNGLVTGTSYAVSLWEGDIASGRVEDDDLFHKKFAPRANFL